MGDQPVSEVRPNGEKAGTTRGEQPFVATADGVREPAGVDGKPADRLGGVQQHSGPGDGRGFGESVEVGQPPVGGLHGRDRDQRRTGSDRLGKVPEWYLRT